MVCKLKKSWIKIEMEHTSNPAIARRIAQDHIDELGCGYYPALKKMEKKLSKHIN